jgi:cytidylate kinase
VLADRADVFRVFVYAPERTKVARLRSRHPEDTNFEELMRTVDDQRVRYIQRYFGRQWNDLRLYDMLISSEPGEEDTAATIIYAMGTRKGG